MVLVLPHVWRSEHHSRDGKMVTNDFNGQDKQLTFRQDLAIMNCLVCKNSHSYAWCHKKMPFAPYLWTKTSFIDQTVNICQVLWEGNFLVLTIGIICDHPAISTVMFRLGPKSGSYKCYGFISLHDLVHHCRPGTSNFIQGKHKKHCYVG